MNMQKIVVRLAIGALLFATSTSWAASGRLVVVHEGGRVTTSALQAGVRDSEKAVSAICDSDATVLFAFTETVSLNAVPSPLITITRANAPADLLVKAEVVCSRIEGTLSLAIDLGGAPSPGAGFSVTPPVGFPLSLSLQEGQAASNVLTVQVTDTTRAGDEYFDIRRAGGSFSGLLADANPVVGALSSSLLSRVTLTGTVVPTTVPDTVGDPLDDPFINDIYQDVVQDFCVQGSNSSTAACNSLVDLVQAAENDPVAAQQLTEALRAISPEKAAVISNNGTQIVAGQVGNVALRIASLLSGNAGGFSTTGLTLAGGGMPLSLSSVGDAISAATEGSDNESLRTLLGGTRWGVWVNGTIGSGDYERLRGNAGFDFNNWSVTTGVDYRLTDQAFFGAALGISQLSSDFEDEQGSLDAKSFALHAYGGYSPTEAISLDGSLSWVHTGYDLTRLIPGSDATSIDSLAQGRPDSSQVSGAFGVSWNFQRNAWTLAPTAQFQFLSTDVDAFSERGDSVFLLRYAKQSIDTRSLSTGVYADYTSATSVGAFRPYGRLLWYADGGTGSRNLIANFISDGTSVDSLKVAEPDRRYGTAELGLNFRRPIGTRTVDFNVGVLSVFGFEALDRWAVRADVRFPF